MASDYNRVGYDDGHTLVSHERFLLPGDADDHNSLRTTVTPRVVQEARSMQVEVEKEDSFVRGCLYLVVGLPFLIIGGLSAVGGIILMLVFLLALITDGWEEAAGILYGALGGIGIAVPLLIACALLDRTRKGSRFQVELRVVGREGDFVCCRTDDASKAISIATAINEVIAGKEQE